MSKSNKIKKSQESERKSNIESTSFDIKRKKVETVN